MHLGTSTVPLTQFIGREREIVVVQEQLAATRLLTLVGAGGTGKTRLAAAVAARWAAERRQPVRWVELTPLQEPDLLAAFLLTAVDAEPGTMDPLPALIKHLRGTPQVLVMDNCEHIVEPTARLVDELLRSCPDLCVLATSREALGVGGERSWRVPGLSLPAEEDDPATVRESEAVRLFVDRAGSARASFRLTTANAGAVARICRRLDGLPLAIELAAARIASLTPEQLDERLHDVLRSAAPAARTGPDRHRTLRDAINWSYRLLDASERLLLRRLSAFAGDFALEEVEAVCEGESLDRSDVLEVLASLVNKSLVMMREEGASARYHLLEAIRQFAEEELTDSGELPIVCGRHARTFAALVEEAAPHLITAARPRWLSAVNREMDNLRLALACAEHHHRDAFVRLAGQLGWYWYSSGQWSEGRRWLERALAVPVTECDPADRAAVLLGAGVLASLQADVAAAVPWLEESAARFAATGDRRGEAYALAYLGVAHGQGGDEAAREPLERSLAWFRSSGDPYGLRLSLVVFSTFNLVRGAVEVARAQAEEATAVARDFGLDRELAIALQVHATALLATEDLQGAATVLRESLAALRRDPSTFWIARGLQLLGVVLCRQGDARRGVTLLGAAEVRRESLGASLLAHDRDRLAPVLAAARAALGHEEFELTWTGGRTRSTEENLDAAVTTPNAAAPRSADPASIATAAAEPTALRVRALGRVEVRRDGELISSSAWRFARPRELFLYLLAHPEGRSREQIGLTFWPEASTAQVRNSFHVAIHHVRKALGRADLITFDAGRYRIAWEVGVWFDARAFREVVHPIVRAQRSPRAKPLSDGELVGLGDALALYRGDLLAEEGAGDWHLEERESLRRLFLEGATLAGLRHLEAASFGDATSAFERALAVDGLHEPAHRGLMLALARAGDRVGALRQFERLSLALRRELDAEPDPETVELHAQLKGQRHPK